jgi:hypothetical protein
MWRVTRGPWLEASSEFYGRRLNGGELSRFEGFSLTPALSRWERGKAVTPPLRRPSLAPRA